MNPKATLITAVAVCSFTGFLIGRISSQSGPSSSGEGVGGGIGFRSKREAPGSVVRPRASGSSRGRDRGLSSGSADSRDSLARMGAILNNPNALERGGSWLRFVNGLSPSEIEDAVVNLRGSGLAEENLSAYSMLLALWAKHDPISALDYASKNTGPPFARNTILATWAASDPLAAITWAQSNHHGEGANPWMVGVIRGIADSDPQHATALLHAMPDSEERSEALRAVIGQYLEQGSDAVRAWATDIQNEQLRQQAITLIAEKQARTDPEETADWLFAHSGELSDTNVIRSVMQRMTEADPQAAVAYFDGINDENSRSAAFRGITSRMAYTDPHATLTFIDTHPSLADDHAFSYVIEAAEERDPALGATTLSRLQNYSDIAFTYRSYMARWMNKDLDSAAAWIEQNKNELPAPILRKLEEEVAARARERTR